MSSGLHGEADRTDAARARAALLASASVHLAEVTAVEDVLPRLRKITFAGERLGDFDWLGANTCFYTMVPKNGGDIHFAEGWSYEQIGSLPADQQPDGAYYTVRAHRPDQREIDMFFVLHGDAGALSSWAEQAQPGQRVGLWGPRGSFDPPPETDWLLLVCDETGLYAAANALESMPAGLTAKVFAEVADEAWQAILPDVDGAEVTWLIRDAGAEPGLSSLLADAVRAMPWPGGNPYVWGGGETRAMTSVRTYVRHEIGLPLEACHLTGYWRHRAHAGDELTRR